MIIANHVNEGDVEEHAASQSEDVGASIGELSDQDSHHETQVAGARRQEVEHERLTHAHSGVEQNREVTCISDACRDQSLLYKHQNHFLSLLHVETKVYF